MRVVIDTNILMSALIKDSTTREIIIKSNWEFYYPEVSLHEIRKHRNLILQKSGMNEEEFTQLFNHLLSHIKIIPEEYVHKKLDEANKILGKIDPKDVVFLATALSISDSVIWSDDKHFEKQDKVKVLKTKNIIKF